MPRIRKKTSNRGSTNERKKILHKVRESRRKTAKASKKNPQWKSTQKKDPGIPSNYPYKDQLLAEVAEQRRQTAEEKQRRQDEKNTPKPKKKKSTDDDGDDSDEEEDATTTAADTFDGIASLSAKRLVYAKAKGKPASVVVEDDAEEEEEVPFLINHDLPTLQSVLDQADVVVHVLDARDPNSFRTAHLERLTAAKTGQRVLLVLNKIDTCPRESVAAWSAHLRTQHPTVIFRSATSFLPSATEVLVKGKGKAKERSDDAWGADAVLSHLGKWSSEKKGNEPLAVAVVGITNSGKSSLINSLVQKPVFPIYKLSSSSRGPTTTPLPQEVLIPADNKTLTKPIRFIDTPGLSWALEESPEDIERVRARDILLRNKGRIDRLKDPAFAVTHIVSRGNTEDLMLLYNLPAFAKGDPESFLNGVARANQLIKKKGALDVTGASRIVLRDWSIGKFPWYTSPPGGVSKGADAPVHKDDEAILARLQIRKEMRKSGGGLVRFSTGEVESRKPTLDSPWVAVKPAKDSDDESDDEEDVAMGEDLSSVDEQIEDDDDDEDDAGEQEEEPAPIISSKQQKRKAAAALATARPTKKVAFSADPKESKQARRAASIRKGPIREKVDSEETSIADVLAKTKKPKAKETVTKVKAKVSVTTSMVTATKSKGKSAIVGDGEEAYDFGKFF